MGQVDEAWLVVLQAADSSVQGWLPALKSAGSAQALLGLTATELARFGLAPSAVEKLRAPDRERIAGWHAWLAQTGHGLTPFGSSRYPERLAQIHDPPLALWTDGPGLDLFNDPQLAVVGSRHPTLGGRRTAKGFAADLSARGITVTSGLATGIDAAGHEGALLGAASTVAVLGSGLDRIYPRRNTGLASEIRSAGLIVSEYPPGTQPRPYHFPRRNRIIAGLTLGTIVVEATRRSGSLITAALALDCGREVFAIPGSIHNPLARGCHQLLRSGAKLVEHVDDILIELLPVIDIPSKEYTSSTVDECCMDDPEHRRLLDALGFEPASISELVAEAGLTAADVSSMLLLLEMKGIVEALPGGRYCRVLKRT